MHRPELEHVELDAVAADTRLAEEDRPSEGDVRRDREAPSRRGQDDQERRADDPVDRVLDRVVEPARIRRMRRDEREAADVVDGEARRRPLVQARHDGHRDAELLAAADEAEQHVVRRRREGDDHLLDVVLADDLLEIPARAEHGQHEPVAVVGARLLVQVADRLQAELRHLREALRRQPADAARARRSASAGDPSPALQLPPPRPVDRGPPRGEIRGREEPEPQRLVDRVAAGADERCTGQQRDRSEARRTRRRAGDRRTSARRRPRRRGRGRPGARGRARSRRASSRWKRTRRQPRSSRSRSRRRRARASRRRRAGSRRASAAGWRARAGAARGVRRASRSVSTVDAESMS